MNERFKLIRSCLGFSQAAFASKIGLSKSGISNIENGTRNVTNKHIKLVLNEFNVNEKWLRYGIGEMFIEKDKKILDSLESEYNLNSLDREMLELYLKLSPTERKTINQFVLLIGNLASKSIKDEV